MTHDDSTKQFPWLGLGAITAGGTTIRVLAALTFFRPGAIGGEGAEYARIAENLRLGMGYVGIAMPGPELMFPPLFPGLIALSSLITGDYEWAGRLVALLFSAALPLPVYGIASRLFGRTIGLNAAFLIACHPLLIGLSTRVLSEAPYMTLLLSAVYLVVRAIDPGATARDWCYAGAVFGLAYLTRQEAVAVCLLAAVGAAVTAPSCSERLKHCAAILLAFVVVASPYLVFLYQNSGQLRVEQKSAVNLVMGKRMLAGEDSEQAAYGIDKDLRPTGVAMIANSTVVRMHVSWRERLQFTRRAARQNTSNLFSHLSAAWMGGPFLVGLALLGLFGRPWHKSVASQHLFVLLAAAPGVLATFTVVHGIYPRNYFPLIPFLSIWAAGGMLGIVRWTKATVSSINPGRLRSLTQVLALSLIALVSVLAWTYTASHAIRDSGLDEESLARRDVKETGLWIGKQQNHSPRVMDLWTTIAFHANAQYVHFPYCSEEAALKFLDAAEVDYVVLRRGFKFARYYDDWVASGIPDDRAVLVFASTGAQPGSIVVFRWRRTNTDVKKWPLQVESLAEQLPTVGPLRVDPRNPRYFADRREQTVLLAGSHTWGNFQDGARMGTTAFDYDSYLRSLAANHHNFMRLWAWEQANWASWRPYDWRISPNAYRRTGPGTALDGGPRFDLAQLNPEYFRRLRQRVQAARALGIYVAIMLFNGFSVEPKGDQAVNNPWRGHPFNRENNVNGVNGDADGNGDGREIHTLASKHILRLQEQYVKAVIDAVGDLDNVLYEIINEAAPGSIPWQNHMVEFIHGYERSNGRQHPVGITVEWPSGNNDVLFHGPAEWVSPNSAGGYDNDPPPATGNKVIVSDTDHIWGIGGDPAWVWKSVTRGLNVLLMDTYDNRWMFPPIPEHEQPRWSELRRTIGYARRCLGRFDLSGMTPHPELATSRYCLANPGSGSYLVYVPDGRPVEVNLTAATGMLEVAWLDPLTGRTTAAPDVRGGTLARFLPPQASGAALSLRSRPGAVAASAHATAGN